MVLDGCFTRLNKLVQLLLQCAVSYEVHKQSTWYGGFIRANASGHGE